MEALRFTSEFHFSLHPAIQTSLSYQRPIATFGALVMSESATNRTEENPAFQTYHTEWDYRPYPLPC